MDRAKCNDLATKVITIYNISAALTQGWNYLYPERRAESLFKLKERVNALIGGGIDAPHSTANVKSAKIVLERLETLERYNSGEGTIPNVPEKLLPAVVDMAVESILDCGCREAGYLVERD